MFRNLSKRVEVVAPVRDAEAKAKLWEILDICLRDRRQIGVSPVTLPYFALVTVMTRLIELAGGVVAIVHSRTMMPAATPR